MSDKKLQTEKKVSFRELLEFIPSDVMKVCIINRLTEIAKNQIIGPVKNSDESTFDSVYFNGEMIEYHITVPILFKELIEKFKDEERNNICLCVRDKLSDYNVSYMNFMYAGSKKFLVLNFHIYSTE